MGCGAVRVTSHRTAPFSGQHIGREPVPDRLDGNRFLELHEGQSDHFTRPLEMLEVA